MTTDRLQLSLSAASQTYVFDRSRLLIDLDEASDPAGPASTLLVVGFRRRRDRSGSALTHNDIALLDRLIDLIGSHGAVYRTRATEVSALVDLTAGELESLLDNIRAALVEHERGSTVGIGMAGIPAEAGDPVSALALADERLIGQTAGVRVANRFRTAVGAANDAGSGLAVVIDLVPRVGARPTRRAGGLGTVSSRRDAAYRAGLRRA